MQLELQRGGAFTVLGGDCSGQGDDERALAADY